jgi:hypothetical protein|tara:strand:- start:410 stop:1105 length:696 start_codon:yes stop_codon:yes gene_type:complete
MKKLILISLSSFLVWSTTIQSEIVEVYTWKAIPGETASLLSNMQAAAVLHSSDGADVDINQLNVGAEQVYDYILRYDDLEAWGKSKDATASNQGWVDFWNEVGSTPAGVLQSSFTGNNLDTSVKANAFADYNVFAAYVWNANTGYDSELLSNFAKAKQIHESLGAKVHYYTEGFGSNPGSYHYVMLYKNWTQMGKVQQELTSNSEWLEFYSNINPEGASMTRSLTGQIITN